MLHHVACIYYGRWAHTLRTQARRNERNVRPLPTPGYLSNSLRPFFLRSSAAGLPPGAPSRSKRAPRPDDDNPAGPLPFLSDERAHFFDSIGTHMARVTRCVELFLTTYSSNGKYHLVSRASISLNANKNITINWESIAIVQHENVNVLVSMHMKEVQ